MASIETGGPTAFGLDLTSGRIDAGALHRQVYAPRSGETRAEYAQALHHEQVRRHGAAADRVLLFLAGIVAGITLGLPLLAHLIARVS